MLIKCPKCQTVYTLNDDVVSKDGLKMRCSKCREVFKVYPEDAFKEPEPKQKDVSYAKIFEPFSKTTEEMFRPNLPQKVRVVRLTRYKNTINYLLLLALLALVFALLYLTRFDIVRYVPKAEALYQKFGIEALKDGFTLDFENVVSQEFVADSVSHIKITGIIKNGSKYVMRVPPVQIVVYNAQGKELMRMVHILAQKKINPEYKIPFEIVFPNPTPEQKNINVSFNDKVLKGK
ncbi:MAG: zinc-ribbon domain-containing protein [Alphaproteobacteria bacterium]|nr:zinc-ribbon domain-containing protein [Alphaproteobacteria bacterium]